MWENACILVDQEMILLRQHLSYIWQIMPLGAAAVAGTHLNVDLKKIAQSLGFELPPVNSIHAVSDRDGVIEIAQLISMFGFS